MDFRPHLARDAERHTWGECRGEQGGRIVHLDVDIGHRPRKDLAAHYTIADDHALKRLGILGSMGMSRDIRKEFFHVASAGIG